IVPSAAVASFAGWTAYAPVPPKGTP
ncbi:MAG: hypothetical protein QOG59_98, partial [Solirubrobacteraceae bacterium]|nr:hypothetical protein [Solirubrobacteraceae bacterium]